MGTGFGYQAFLDLPTINSTAHICRLPGTESDISGSPWVMIIICPVFGATVSAVLIFILALPLYIIFRCYKRTNKIYKSMLETIKIENKSYEKLNPTMI